MEDKEKPKQQLINELAELSQRITDLEKPRKGDKCANEALQVSETRYRRLFETAQDGILLLDADTGKINEVNPFLIDMLGYSHEELLGKKLWEISLFKDIVANKAAFFELQNNGYVRYEDLPLETKDGRSMDVEFVSNVYLVNHNKIIQCNIRDITQRKRAEKISNEAFRYAENIIDTVHEPFVVMDKDLKVLSANRSFYSTFEVTPDETVGNLIYDIGNRQWDIPSLRTLLEDILPKNSQFKDYEVSHKFLTIGQKTMLLNARQIHQEVIGTPMILLAIEDITEKRRMEDELRNYREHIEQQIVERTAELKMTNEQLQLDITERKQAEKALRESEERYRRIVEYSPYGIAIHSEGKLVYMNLAGAKILGMENPDEIVGKMLLQIVHPDYHEITIKRVHMQEEGKVAPPLEEKFLRLDGTPVDVEVASIPFNYMGKLAMYGVFRDITERKQAEEIQRKLSSAVEHTADIVVIANKDGTIEYVNPAFEKITGYTMEEAVGKTPRILKSGKQDEKFYEILWETILSGEVFYGVLINKKHNGELYFAEKTITPVKEEHGSITHFVSTDKDITERMKAEEEHLENKRLEAADKAKSEFLANMSHELRTPLNASIGFSELLKLGNAGELNEKQKHYADNILTSSQFLLSLINDILDLSKIEAGKIELFRDRMSVPETIKETLSLIKEKAMKHKVLLKTEFDPELEFIEADKQRFKQILFNLLSNAVKFSKEERGTVTITAKKEGDMAQISISDTGIGIKEENIGRLFHKFEQLEKGISKKYGGTGLGLDITKHLVELHKGKIWVKSRYGEGSTFTFLLPIEVKKKEDQ
jgi:PAS domain S-box-containing protein